MTGLRIYPVRQVPRHSHARYSLIGILTLALVASAAPVHAQTTGACFDDSAPTPEGYGPTDISATTGNGALSVALNPDATVTVLKWPSPSFYDQIKYRTTDRAEPRFGALRNEGAFIGIAWRRRAGAKWTFTWLRNWRSTQRFADDDNDEVVTTYRRRSAGLKVKLRDVVAADSDVLFRHIVVRRSARSPARLVRVISFANFNPVFSKTAQDPTDDWCTEEDNDGGAVYVERADAIAAVRSGTDASTGEPSSVALTIGFQSDSEAHQVGIDTFGGNTGGGRSAYADAADGKLTGRDEAPGQVDGAMADDLDLRSKRRRSTTTIITAGFTRREAVSELRRARRTSIGAVRRAKNAWWRAWLRPADLPRGAPNPVIKLAKRSLITIRQVTDMERSMVVASIATQAPYGLDWVRNGVWLNRALEHAGHPSFVAKHDKRYGDLQSTAADPPQGQPATPAGNWAQNHYADGVAGGPIAYTIDQTGYGIFTLWDRYALGGNRDYLVQAAVYEAIQRAAHYLNDPPPFGCTDPTTGLQCAANEGDNETPTRTLVGAQAVWLGLDAAASAAAIRGGETAEANAAMWAERRDEVGAAIDTNFYDEECTCYTTDYQTGGAFLWPVGIHNYGSVRSRGQAAENYRHMTGVLSGEITTGGYESKMLLGNAFAWAGSSDMAKVRTGLKWVARVPTTARTGLLGEAWMVYPPENGDVTTMVSQPHAPNHAMFYLAALKAYGTTRYSFD